jgi:trk system potassium uptake protein
MKFQVVGFTLGLLIAILGLSEMVPAIIDAADAHPNAEVFFFNGVLCLFFGGSLVIANRQFHMEMGVREAFLLTTLSWVVIAAFAALPFYMSDMRIGFTDAYFESMSGLTTTGTSVLPAIDEASRGILMWRSIIQWIGGMGIVGFAMVLLPFLKVAGMQLFLTESSDKSDKIMPRSKDVVVAIFQIYFALTILCALVYRACGMGWFDAVNHAMTTISTAGYSTHANSFEFFADNRAVQYAASFFMFIASLPFSLFIILAYRRKLVFWQDEQIRAFTLMTVFMVGLVAVWLFRTTDYGLEASFRYALFNMVSILSTTGYASVDYSAWGSFAVVAFLFALYVGGCAGSTAGGPKVMRILISARMAWCQIKRLLYPRGHFPVYYQGRVVDSDVAMSVLGFLSFYVLLNVVLSIVVALSGTDFLTAVSATAMATSNVGNGVGHITGPSGSFSMLPGAAKWVLCVAMLLGRLEILTVMVLFSSHYWRR